jgi:putative protein-disulfide isomerase
LKGKEIMQDSAQKTLVTYLFDPLCGWCYGASPGIQRLGRDKGVLLELAPTGLFTGAGGRSLDASFADYAWSNDTRIEKLTGQRFTEAYHTQVLRRPGGRFDSAATTLALTAVALSDAPRELDTLQLLQEARYVHGLDTSAATVVLKLLRDAGLGPAADRMAAGDRETLAANAARLRKAQGLMQSLGVQGVPALVITNGQGSRLLRGELLYGDADRLLEQITSA